MEVHQPLHGSTLGIIALLFMAWVTLNDMSLRRFSTGSPERGSFLLSVNVDPVAEMSMDTRDRAELDVRVSQVRGN